MLILSLFVTALIVFTLICILEMMQYNTFKKNIYFNIMKGSKRKKMILSNDVMELHSAYSRLEVDVFKVSKLQLRSITPDSFTQHVVNNIYLLLPIFLSLMSMAIALITTIQDTNISDTMESDLNAIILLTFALGCMSTAYLLHAMLEAKKKEILQKHLVVVAEIENERSEK